MIESNALIQWAVTGGGPEAADEQGDVAVFADGRVRIGPRLAGGEPVWRRLSPSELETLCELVFRELRVLEIDGEEMAREVRSSALERKAAEDSKSVELFTSHQMDAGTTLLRATDEGRTREIRHHDLFGDAHAYPEVEALQRLRRIEMRMIELAEDLLHREC